MDKEIVITEKICTGCHACYSICPKKAIDMKSDQRGFLQPVINEDLCVRCKMCQKVCPLNEKTMQFSGEPIAYAAYSLNEKNHKSSSSGGIFSLLASEVLQREGIIYGAVFTEKFKVEHRRIAENISPLMTSKYVQSQIGDVFCQVERDICDGKWVLFSGTPCQVGGLYNYLIKRKVNTEKLLMVDLICHGVPSPLLWEKHLETIANDRTPKFVNFRDKRLSWGGFSLTCQFADDSEYSIVAGEDAYMQGFFANMTLRESCYSCHFKTKSRISDITLADYWGIEKHDPDMENRNGTSAVIIHSPKGNELFDAVAAQMCRKEIPISSVLAGNSAMVHSVSPHPRKDLFWRRAIEQRYEHFEEIVEELLVPTMSEKINLLVVKWKRVIKRILNLN